MWQRIQTLYMGLSCVLTLAMLLSNLAVLYSPEGEIAGEFSYAGHLPFLILLIIILLLDLIALSAYKHLVFQMRTAGLAAIITLALQIWVGIVLLQGDQGWVFRLPAIFPTVCVILDVLASRGILADILLVESSDSLRKSRRSRRK